ncbi:putative tetrahydrofolylpolyglutamate synthase [Trichodelitschia bisporula]|uniref:Folylpolyglutamate synthase n=1 Tax=Trichodelitschia bisporula TaxID=703511 RepID=A0A6G1IAG6_9PEZI|nr:putative tetrahydrofolylpolyglutamate synthase [Trichodelitschia bisporula]
MAARDYNAAVTALNSLQSNFSIVDAIRKSGRGMNKDAIPEMLEFWRRLGYQPEDIDRINPIHIAGTKGKGSTSAFVASILQRTAVHSEDRTPCKVGLYTSPHLRFVRERIQINNVPLSEDLFAKYFFEVWDRLSSTADGSKPVYFRYLTLMAFHTYIQEGVDAAVTECGIGGEYDSTNILIHKTVAAVTALGIDHVGMLGGTLPEIAWHKAGIFRRGAAALTVPQPEPAMAVLRQRAEEQGATLEIIPTHPAIASGEVELGLAGDFQKSNASLAVAIVAAHLRAVNHPSAPALDGQILPPAVREGLELVKWPGRCDLRNDIDGKIAWCFDGGHTLESLEVGAQWFASVASGRAPPILIFNQQTRDARALARGLHSTLAKAMGSDHPFSHVIFTTNVTYKDAGYSPDLTAGNANAQDVQALRVQKELAALWGELDPEAEVEVLGTIEEAVGRARGVAGEEEAVVLVTGSLHLVGGALEVLEGRWIAAR